MALRIIKDPSTKSKWLVTEKGIKADTAQYLGTISWDLNVITKYIFANKGICSKRELTQGFINMVTTKGITPKYHRKTNLDRIFANLTSTQNQ